MKLTLVLLTAAFLQVSASSYSQRVTIKVKEASIKSVFDQIQAQTGYDFLYNAEDLKKAKPINLNFTNASLKDVLEKCFSNQSLTYSIDNTTILIKNKVNPPPLVIADAIQKTISGKVIDDKGAPLPGVTIKLKSQPGIATVTDANGNYRLVSPDDDAVFVYSFVGFETQEISIRGKTTINVTLNAVNTGLNEIVVVAYGTQKRTSVTGAVGTVNADEIKKNSISDITNTITGRTPGVRINQLSSQPGKFNTSIDIRGFASVNGGGITPTQTGAPLFVIDGVPRSQDDFARLDPNEIESFSVLKDATAAIYGVKAANGVILVTTRKGSQGSVKVDYSGQWGAQFILKYPELANGADYATLLVEQQFNGQESNRSDPFTPQFSQQDIADYRSGKLPSVDWIRLTIKKRTNQQQHNVTVTGGSEKVKFFTSAGYFKEGGVLASNIEKDQKYNFRQTVTAEIFKGLTFDVNLGLIDVVTSAPNTNAGSIYNLVRNTWQIPPTETVYSNGDPAFFRQFLLISNDNPVALENRDVAGYDDNNARRFTSTFSLNYNLPWVQGLSAKALFAYDNNYSLDKNFAKTFNQYQFDPATSTQRVFTHSSPSQLTNRFDESIRNDIQFSLNYQRHIGKHNITALALYEQIYNQNDFTSASTKFAVDAIDQIDAGNRATDVAGGNRGQNATRSYVGRLNYDYAGKYLLEAGAREDGSSYFAPTTRYGFFPYASAGWRISEEPFIKNNLKFVDNIKIRASYGKLGDDQIAGNNYPAFLTGYTYPSKGTVYDGDNGGRTGGSGIGTVFGNSGGITKGVDFKSVANTEITWYTSKTTDIGLEMSFWNGKLTFEGDIFRRDRDGLLASRIVSIAGTFGAALPQVNLNSDRTQGFELTLGHRSKVGDVSYGISANMGFTRTQYRHFEENPATNPYDNYRNKASNRYTDAIWGYVVAGQFQNYQQIYSAPIQDGNGNRTLLPGDLNYVDLNGDGVINTQDQKIIANGGAKPLIYFGTTLDASWKNFDISALVQGATMYHVIYQDQLSRPFYFANADPITAFVDRWHRANMFDPNSPWIPGRFPSTGQRQNYKDVNGTTVGNTFNVFDGTYARLKQIQIGYSFPKKMLSKVGLSRLRVFATAYNIATWSSKGLSFVDPEYTDTNLYGYNYPITMNVNAGVQVTF